ncbi:MAG: choice-of-anchor Q domain-containing protein, partial [Thermoanaerobaculia bacterium]
DDTLTNLEANSTCDLREAVRNVNAGSAVHDDCPAGDGVDDEIQLSVAGTIVLTGADGEDDAASGDLDVREDVVIRNTSGGEVVIDGGANPDGDACTDDAVGDRVFEGGVSSLTPVDWEIDGGAGGIVLQNGGNVTSGGCIDSGRNSTLTLRSVTVTGCRAVLNGGGIETGGATLVEDSLITGNCQTFASNGGGGIFSFLDELRLENTEVSGNEAHQGGGLHVSQEGNAVLDDSRVLDNHARTEGGGIHFHFLDNDATIQNGTRIEGNTTDGAGGGISMLGSSLSAGELFVEASQVGSLASPNLADALGGGIFSNGGSVTLREGTVVEGNETGSDGGGIATSNGAVLQVSESSILDNSSSDSGGGAALFDSQAIVQDSLIAGNVADFSGGGLTLFGVSGSSLVSTIERTAIRDNTAAADPPQFASAGGGAIAVDGFGADSLEIVGSELSGNQVLGSSGNSFGGAVMVARAVSVRNSTVSGNSAPRGGGFGWNADSATLTLNNVTLFGNASTLDQGADIGTFSDTGAVTATNTVFASPAQGDHCDPTSPPGSIDGSNLVQPGGSCGSAVPGDPKLGALADNGGSGPGLPGGGFTRTHAIVSDASAARDSPAAAACEVDDQRGVARAGACDLGAYESGDEVFQVDLRMDKSVTPAVAGIGDPVTFTLTVTNEGPGEALGASVADAFPPELADVSWTCTADPGASCSGTGAGDVEDTVDLPPGASVVYTATATLDAAEFGTVTNTATVSPAAGFDTADPDLGSDEAVLDVQGSVLEIPVLDRVGLALLALLLAAAGALLATGGRPGGS